MDLTVYRENSCLINLNIKNYDLTGATIYFTVKPDFDEDENDTSAVIQTEITDHIDPENGVTSIRLTPAQTNVTPDKYKYDIKIKLADNEQHTLLVGNFIVNEVVTLRA